MEAVKVIEIIGSKSAVSPRTGLKAYDFVTSELSKSIPIAISFEGIEDLTSAFCNSFIGKLYMNFEPGMLDSNLTITGIEQSHVWFKKIKNAILLGTNENARTLHKVNLEEVIFS